MASGEFIANVLSETAEVFGKTLNGTILNQYCTALKDAPEDELKQAALKWVRSGNRFPYPSDLLGLIEQQACSAP